MRFSDSFSQAATWRVVLLLLVLLATVLVRPGAAEAQVTTQDAQGCNGDVCIILKGSGTNVTSWRTTAGVSGYQCGYAYFWRNGSVIRTVYACGTGTLSTTWSSPGSFSDGDELCNSWSAASGYPCKYIIA